MAELIHAVQDLGYVGMLGLLRAKRDGLLTQSEYCQVKEYAYTVLGVPSEWWRVLVWSPHRA